MGFAESTAREPLFSRLLCCPKAVLVKFSLSCVRLAPRREATLSYQAKRTPRRQCYTKKVKMYIGKYSIDNVYLTDSYEAITGLPNNCLDCIYTDIPYLYKVAKSTSENNEIKSKWYLSRLT